MISRAEQRCPVVRRGDTANIEVDCALLNEPASLHFVEAHLPWSVTAPVRRS
jgi:hypothetical protein